MASSEQDHDVQDDARGGHTPLSDDLEAQQRGEPQAEHGGHGTSLAAWVACGGVILGALVVSLALIFGSTALAVAGGALIVVMALMWPVLSRAGYGEKSANREVSGGPRAVR